MTIALSPRPRLSPFVRRIAGLTAPILLLLCAFFVVPVLMLLSRSVTEPSLGLQNYATVFGTPTYARIFFNTFLVSGLVTAITLAIAFPLAWGLTVFPKTVARILFGLLLLSMWTNLLARTYAWMVLLQRTGMINRVLMDLGLIDQPLALVNNLTGVTIGMVYIMLPFMVMPLYGVLSKLDPSILQAAALCGASRFQALTRVLWPLARPGVASGALMVFVMSLGYFVTPALLGGTANMMLAELIAQQVQSLVNWGMGGALALVLLVVTLALYAVQVRFASAEGGR